MVRPAKPSDIKVGSPPQKMSTKILRPDIEDRYRTEAPKLKKAPEKKKSPIETTGTILLQKGSIDKKPGSPLLPRLSKFSTLQSDTGVAKKVSVPKSKSQTKSPYTATPKKTKKNTTKKVDSKESPLFRLLNERIEKPSSPAGEAKPAPKKVVGIVSGVKKTKKKSSLKKSTKTTMKNLSFNLKPTTDSIMSLTTHFRMPFSANESAISRKPTLKKRKSTVQKKASKSKGDQEDPTKAKTKRKSKLNATVDRVLSTDSVPIFSVRKLKHNDSFVISARKLQKSSSERRNHKPDRLKLNVSTSITKKRTDSFPLKLKPCLKKTLEGENKTDCDKKHNAFSPFEGFQIV